ncbi:hypothetical protein BK723_07960 [Bacillus thuringiensis serovar pondicheriensis]|nr:hypothetical protein BK723_07960 [Bacillus thuringiensis serovar pondicheriensis]
MFLFVTGLVKKLYNTLQTLSVRFPQNTGPQYVLSYGYFLPPIKQSSVTCLSLRVTHRAFVLLPKPNK